MKILFILPEYYPHSGGGISTYYLHYLKALRPKVNQIKVLVGSAYTQSSDKFDHDGIEVEYLEPSRYQKYLSSFSKLDIVPDYKKAIASAWALWEQGNEGEKYDIIECTDFGLGFIPWIVYNETPVVVRLHGSAGQIDLNEPARNDNFYGDFCRQAELIMLEKANLLVTYSKTNQTFWSTIFPKKDVQLIAPIYTITIDGSASIEKSEFGMVCGRIQEWKGPDLLCKAIDFDDKLNTKIRWYGRDTQFDKSLSKAEQLEKSYPHVWGKKIIPFAPLPHKDLLLVQKMAYFAVIPSTWDMFNFTCVEYMAAGVPVICSTGAGVSELINHGVNGFKFENGDFKALAKCIQKVLELNESEYRRITEAAQLTLQSQLHGDLIVEKNLAQYHQLIKDFKPVLSNVFQDAIFIPSEKTYAIDNILAKLPLKVLVKYVGDRFRKKLKLF